MIGNKYKRITNGWKTVKKVYSGFFLDLGEEHGLWRRLKRRHRIMAGRMGATHFLTVLCPVFWNVNDLVSWVFWLLRQDDLDLDLRKAILESMGGDVNDRK